MRSMRVVYGGLTFLSAFLLFTMEPMAAKQLLPLLGGSSAVWITCLVFFQAALLVGYLYAHWLARQARIRVHAWLAMAALVVLLAPIAMYSALGVLGVQLQLNWDVSAHPVSAIFAILGATIGLPFVLLSATSPLFQVWWTRQMQDAVPYRLFGVSNAGSLLALAMYPTIIEPHLSLAAQRSCWVAAFLVYTVGSVWLGDKAARHPLVSSPPEAQLVRGSDGLFRLSGGGEAEADGNVTLSSGALEGSNVNVVEAMVDMISLSRQFETHMKLLQNAEGNAQRASQLLSISG